MRVLPAACAALLLSGCGAASPRPTGVPDDLELDGALARRTAPPAEGSPAADPDDAPAGAPPGATPAVQLEVEAPPAGAPPPQGGARIRLTVRDAPIADVLRMVAGVADVGLVVADDVRGTVTLDVAGVTWRQAIDVIAHLEGLAVTEQDGIVQVRRAP